MVKVGLALIGIALMGLGSLIALPGTQGRACAGLMLIAAGLVFAAIALERVRENFECNLPEERDEETK